MAFQWYALRTKPHKEQAVYRQLLADEVTAYFPCLQVKPKNPRASKIRAYFPGYMFVNLDLDVGWTERLKLAAWHPWPGYLWRSTCGCS